METQVAPVDQTTTTPVTEVTQPVSGATALADPFALDESRLASLSPEQRANLQPVFDDWKKKAQEQAEKTGKTVEEKYKPLTEKAAALDHLVKNQKFQEWWRAQQTAATSQNPAGGDAISQTKPQDFATPEEWSTAVLDASNGNPAKLSAIQARMWSIMSTPVVKQLQEKQAALESTLEMKSLFERHPDAKDLDQIGRNPDDASDKSPSLLEIAMHYSVDKQGQTIQQGYELAKKWRDQLGSRAKQEALGLVQDKKGAVTASQSTTTSTAQPIVEVADADEMIRRNMEAIVNGQKPPKFVIKRGK